VQNFDYDEAAAKLGCKRRFLEDNISRLPHQKIGTSVAFCDCELALIQAMHSVMPPEALALIQTSKRAFPASAAAEITQHTASSVSALASLRPSRSRRPHAVS